MLIHPEPFDADIRIHPEPFDADDFVRKALASLELTVDQAIARNIPIKEYYDRGDGIYQRAGVMRLPGHEVHCHIREMGEWDHCSMYCVTTAEKRHVRSVILRRKVSDDDGIVVYLDPDGSAVGGITAHESYPFWEVALKFQNEKTFWKMMQVSANIFNESRPWKDRGLSFSGKLKSALSRLCLVSCSLGY